MSNEADERKFHSTDEQANIVTDDLSDEDLGKVSGGESGGNPLVLDPKDLMLNKPEPDPNGGVYYKVGKHGG